MCDKDWVIIGMDITVSETGESGITGNRPFGDKIDRVCTILDRLGYYAVITLALLI